MQRGMRSWGVAALAALATAFAVLVIAPRAQAATINVSTAAQLLAAVDVGAAGDVIVLAPGTYTLTAPLEILRNLTIQGPATGPGAVIDGRNLASADPPDAITVSGGTSVTIRNVTVTGGVAASSAIASFGTLVVEGSTLSGNSGRALFVGLLTTATLRNTTVTGNLKSAILVSNNGTLALVNATVADNWDAGITGGITATVDVVNSIIAGGANGTDCAIPVTSSTTSISTTGDCGTDILGDPLLGALTSAGSSTAYFPLPVTPALSPAIDAGTAASCPATDQRGSARSDGLCDIGAYEHRDTVAPVLAGVPAPISVTATGPSGAIVTFATPTATDDVNGDLPVACNPPSGAIYPVGTTTVTCTATDATGNAGTGTFTITVLPPLSVAGCSATGKVAGRGSTAGRAAIEALARGFSDDLCGRIGSADASIDGNTMLAYNSAGLPVGSGEAIRSVGCRQAAFGLSEIPFTVADLTLLNGPVPSTISPECSPLQAANSPFVPTQAPFPSSGDAGSRKVMAFPISGSAIAVGINLAAAQCGGTNPAAPQLTMDEVSRLLGGEIKTWSDPTLRTGGRNATLASCATPVVRVVRPDRSGDTQILKNALAKGAHGSRTGAACGAGSAWSFFASDLRNTTWPDVATSPDATCSDLLQPVSGGTVALLALCTSTPGAVCYAAGADLQAAPGSTLKRASIRNASDTAYQAPLSGLRANCNLSTIAAPGSGTTGWVNLDATDTWALDNPAGNRGDVTFTGSAYPICGLTFALVYTGLRDGSVANPISRLNGNQRRTLQGFFSYALSSLAQDRLNTASYAALPATSISQIRAGFQANI